MRIYFAVGAREYLYMLLLSGVKNVLCSYAYPEPFLCSKLLKRHGIKMMIDSGAYTAWSKDKEINLDEYVEFIKKNKDVIDEEKIVNLDVIMGGRKAATQQEFDEACRKGFENYYYLKEKLQPVFAHEVFPIHVFHQGDNFVWLEKMLKECKYIGISPNKDAPIIEVDRWLYQCYYIIKQKGMLGKIKTHAFGLTSGDLLTRYPYDTADSSAWALTSAFGSILTPFGRFTVSEEQKNEQDFIEYLPLATKQKVIEYIEKHGFSYELVKKKYKYRNLINIVYYLELEDRLNSKERVFSDHQKPLFDFLTLAQQSHELTREKRIKEAERKEMPSERDALF